MSPVQEQQARQILLDSLYMSSGRNDPAHPMHGLYTGLVVDQWTEERVRQAFLDWWAQSYAMKPGVHAITTHVAFGQYLLSLQEG